VYIINFVFWVGIGHAGTLISAILSSGRLPTSIYRLSEAMTVFAVATTELLIPISDAPGSFSG
jgi:molybdopterin-containing oxidoreductase family membrane subunit